MINRQNDTVEVDPPYIVPFLSLSTRELDGRTGPVPRLWIRSAEVRGLGGTSLGEWEHNNNKKYQ